MSPTLPIALLVLGCAEPPDPPLPTPDLVEVPDGEPLRPWVQVIVAEDWIGVEPGPWLAHTPEDAELPPPFRTSGPPDAMTSLSQDLYGWLRDADEAAHDGHANDEPGPHAWDGLNVLVDAEAPGPLVLEGLQLATRTVTTVQIAGRTGDRPRGVLGRVRATCGPTVAVVLAEDGAAVLADGLPLGACGMTDAAMPGVVGEWLAACRPRWAAIAEEQGEAVDGFACASAYVGFDPEHTNGRRLVEALGAMYALDARLSVQLPYAVPDPACEEAPRALASLTDEELDRVCQVAAVREGDLRGRRLERKWGEGR